MQVKSPDDITQSEIVIDISVVFFFLNKHTICHTKFILANKCDSVYIVYAYTVL